MRLLLIRVCVSAAAAVSGYLLWLAQTGRSAPGCSDAGGGCGAVLGSTYASWFGLPVAALAVAGYGVMLAATFNTRHRLGRAVLGATAVAVAGSAVWFTALQVFALRAWCPLCLTTHGLGVTAAALTLTRWHPAAALLGLLPVAGLMAGQLFHSPAPQPVTPPRFAGFVNLHPQDYPTLGPPTAPVAIAYLYDPNCAVCRDVHEHLLAARERYGDELVVAMMPVPFSDRCNGFMSQTPEGFESSCELTRLTLAVWLAGASPDDFEAFDRFLFTGDAAPSPDAARAFAAERVGEEALAATLEDPRIDAMLEGHARLFNALARSVPRLIVAGEAYPPLVSAGELFRLLETETALQSPDSGAAPVSNQKSSLQNQK